MVAPGASFIRQVLLNMWNQEALYHEWDLPDGFHAKVRVLDMEDAKIEVDELNHATFTYRYTVNAPQEKSVALAANVIQSIDGYIVREMTRRCNHDKGALSAAKELLLRVLDKAGKTPSDAAEWLSIKTGMTSLEGMENLEYARAKTFSRAFCIRLINLIKLTMEHDSFPLVSIHDEFKCHPNYMNDVRFWYAEIMAELAESPIMDAILSQLANEPIVLEKFKGHETLGDKIRQAEYPLS